MFVRTKREGGYESEPLAVITAGKGHRQERVDRPTGAEVYHVLFVEWGDGIMEDENGKTRLSEGAAIFIPKGVPVSYYGELTTSWITFQGAVADLLAEHYGATDKVIICHAPDLRHQISECADILGKGHAEERLSVSAYGIINDFFLRVRMSTSSTYLVKAKSFINESFMRNLSVCDIASEVGISSSLLYRIFREEEGMSPMEYLRCIRLDHAGRLLLCGRDLRILDVCTRCGFSDAAYFCRVFKEHFGMTPREYRLKNEI